MSSVNGVSSAGLPDERPDQSMSGDPDASAQDQRGLDNPAARFGASMSPRASAKTLQARLIRKERENLERVFASFETEDSVARAAALIAGARRRFIVGHGRSAAFAHLLDLDLSHGVSQVSLIDGQSTRSIDVLTDVRGTDVLVAFSMRRYRRETAELVHAFAQRGGAVVRSQTRPSRRWWSRPARSSSSPPTPPRSRTRHRHRRGDPPARRADHRKCQGSRRRLTERESLIQEMGLHI